MAHPSGHASQPKSDLGVRWLATALFAPRTAASENGPLGCSACSVRPKRWQATALHDCTEVVFASSDRAPAEPIRGRVLKNGWIFRWSIYVKAQRSRKFSVLSKRVNPISVSSVAQFSSSFAPSRFCAFAQETKPDPSSLLVAPTHGRKDRQLKAGGEATLVSARYDS
jgi:hypothetical protein